jgi:predicted transcriptional regulator of viral defense system
MPTRSDQVLALAREVGLLRPRDLQAKGLSRGYLHRLAERGQLVHAERGLYHLPDAPLTEYHSLAEVAKRLPQGVICLLSALEFHGLTTQAPYKVWLAIAPKAYPPRFTSPPLQLVRFSGAALTFGVETQVIEGVPVRITTPAKTVADCFKFRRKVGLDVALEALHQTWRERRATMEELRQAAEVCRVFTTMRPYLEELSL